MYEKILSLVKKLGDELPELAGKIEDIGVKKQWVTAKDIEIEKTLAETIHKFPGEHKIFAEELNDEYISGDSVWVIDPISHTFSFIHGLTHYAVVLSHLVKGEVLFSVIYDPTTKELFTARKGKGSYLNDKRIHVSKSEADLSIIYDP